MKYNFDKIVERADSCCIKYDERKSTFGREDVLPLWIADMDFEAPDFIKDALLERIAHPVFGYGIRDDKYYDAIINWVKRRNGWEIRREWIDFAPGVVSGFVFAIRTLTNEGDGVVIMPPTYPPFAAQIKANNRKIINSPLVMQDGKYTIDFEDLDKKLAGAKALMFCSPHNPSGRVFSKEELQRVGELCCKHNVGIISDEIHSDLVHKPNKHTHIASICKEFSARCITLIAPTKTFNIAGLSTSAMVTPDDDLRLRLREELDRYHVDQGNLFGTAALIAAYNNGEEWLEELLEYIGGNMQFVIDFLTEKLPVVKANRSEATYLMWLDFRDMGMTHEELRDFLVNEAGVGLNDGETFGVEGRGFMRLNLATSKAMIEQALNMITDAYNKKTNK